jgi:hypothetical protein
MSINSSQYDIRRKIPFLTKEKGSATKYTCPVCNGSNLNIQHSSGKYKCYSNECAESDIRAAIDRLEGKPEWKPENKAFQTWEKPDRAASKISYFYPDRSGKNLAKVDRVDNGDGKKDFFQAHISNNGAWIKTMPSEIRISIPIYNYQSVQEAIKADELIWWTEGESVADTLIKMGLCATTTIGGSGGFKSYGDYSRDLDGAKVVLCPDRDTNGLKYMAQVAELLGNRIYGYFLAGSENLWRIPSDGYDLADDIKDYQITSTQLIERIKSIEKFKELTQSKSAGILTPSSASGLLYDPLITELQWQEFAEARSIQPADYNPYDYFPERMADIMLRDAERQCIDSVGYISYLLPVIASLMGHTELDVGGYTIPNIIWTVLVQESGGGKSRIDKLMKAKLVDWEKEEKVIYDQKLANYNVQQASAKANRNFQDSFELPPMRRRYIVKDASVSTVSRLICENAQTAFLWTKDEFSGLLKGLNKQTASDAGDRETLLELWSGGEIIIDRIDKAREMMSSSSRVSLVGGMQPGVITDTFNPKDPQGFLARFLPICPDYRQKIAKRTSCELTQELPALYKFVRGDRGQKWQTIRMDDATWQNCWAPIYDYLATIRSPIPAFQNWLNKAADHVGRVAIALHAIECYYDQSKGLWTLSESTLVRAYALTLMCMDNVKRICVGLTTADAPETLSPMLLKIIAKLDANPSGLHLRDIYQGIRGFSLIAKEESTTAALIAKKCCEELASKGFISFDGRLACRIPDVDL